jgi:hypothetical protein
MMGESLPLYHLSLITLLVVLMFSINPMIFVLDQLQRRVRERLQVIFTPIVVFKKIRPHPLISSCMPGAAISGEQSSRMWHG